MRDTNLLARIAAMATGAVLTAALVLAGPSAAGAPTTTPPPATTTRPAPAPEVGLIPPVCATTDPVAFPCPDGVPVVLP